MKGRTESRGRREAGRRRHGLLQVGLLVALAFAAPLQAGPIGLWQTVVNNGTVIPGTDPAKVFNSYNQPSINDGGLVVFRARSQGGDGQPATGVFTRDMATAGNPVVPIAVRGGEVPDPNNLFGQVDADGKKLGAFNEFPSIPRIDATSNMIATRGQSRPVLEYQTGVDPSTGEPVTTSGGTSGIYTNPTVALVSGMTGLGNVTNATYPANPDLSYFQVPGTAAGTKFDQFPGAPSATMGNTIVFKGNWTETIVNSDQTTTLIGRTGVYFRDVVANGGTAPVQLIADSKTDIPGYAGTPFGSTAPPSAAGDRMVFLGVDNEAAPTKGGIYMAEIDKTKNPNTPSVLETIVSIGQAVLGNVITRLGEALSFDGSKVAFWGAWGDETRAVTVSCGGIENKNVSAFCLSQDNGSTAGSGTADDGFYTFDVPVHQGFFVTDVDTLETRLIAETGMDFLDFVFWNFSGKIPGEEDEEDGEVARWRSTSFIASDGWNAVFKALKSDGIAGLYLSYGNELFTVAENGMDGSVLDSMAAGLPIVSVGIERDGYRNGWLAINASFASAEEGWAGVYVTQVPEPGTLAMLLLAAGLLPLVRRTAPRRA